MNSEVQEFLDSGMLELYVLGELSAKDRQTVESFIASSDQVRSAYNEIQASLEVLVRGVARPAPEGLKEDIMQAITKPTADTAGPDVPRARRVIPGWLSIAAGIAAILIVGVAVWQYQKASALQNELTELQGYVDQLENELEGREQVLASLNEQFEVLSDPATERVVLSGNAQAPGFETIAYWNEVRKSSLLRITDLPELPDDQCYQMWADVEGEMINLGVMPDDTSQLIAWNFLDNAESLNVTIEPAGGSDHPTVSRLVASAGI